MRSYRPYVTQLDGLLSEVAKGSLTLELQGRVREALDGEAASELRRLVPLADLRANGVFFTGSQLARVAVRDILPTIDRNAVILDPACGAGDLLLACTAGLPTETSHNGTLKNWGQKLVGRDLQPELIEAARRRLWLAASLGIGQRNSHRFHNSAATAFPEIEVGCGMSDLRAIAAATHIVMNPPFTMVDAPEKCSWAAGKVNAAALFLEAILCKASPRTRIVAVLPDVLRSGSRYGKWRELVAKKAHTDRLEIFGLFDTLTDVDVFVLQLQILDSSEPCRTLPWSARARSADICVGDRFRIQVGPVVDYRDPHAGPEYPFIHSRDLHPWKTLTRIAKNRRFRGRVVSPPFVAVRRTSRPGDRHRAIGTLIEGRVPYAVENHLITLRPNRGAVQACRELLRVLRDERTTKWLDQRIRCRHLTVSVLRELPWWPETL